MLAEKTIDLVSSKNVSRARVRASALAILLAIFAANFMDRQIVAIFVEPIKRDLVLSDSEIGILYGFAFAVLYTTAGIPIARFADRANRARIINWSLVLFSVMTAICGFVSSYSQFLIARVGVAIGEGGTKPAIAFHNFRFISHQPAQHSDGNFFYRSAHWNPLGISDRRLGRRAGPRY